MLLQITTGEESFSGGSAKFHVFAMPTARFPLLGQGKEVHIGVLAGLDPALSPVRRTSSSRLPAAGGLVDMGSWTKGTYDVPEGLILKLWGQRSVSARSAGSNRGEMYIGAMLLQPRADAALRRIQCVQVGDTRASVNMVSVEGRFDIITAKDAGQAGAPLTMQHIKQMAMPDPSKLFRSFVIDHEIAAKKTVVTQIVKDDKGKSVEVKVAQRRRAVDLD